MARVSAAEAKRVLDDHQTKLKALRTVYMLANAEVARTAIDELEDRIRQKYLEFDRSVSKTTKTAEAASAVLPAAILHKIHETYVRYVCPTIADESRALATLVVRSRKESTGSTAALVITKSLGAKQFGGHNAHRYIAYNSTAPSRAENAGWIGPDAQGEHPERIAIVLKFPGTKPVSARVDVFLGRKHKTTYLGNIGGSFDESRLELMCGAFMRKIL